MPDRHVWWPACPIDLFGGQHAWTVSGVPWPTIFVWKGRSVLGVCLVRGDRKVQTKQWGNGYLDSSLKNLLTSQMQHIPAMFSVSREASLLNFFVLFCCCIFLKIHLTYLYEDLLHFQATRELKHDFFRIIHSSTYVALQTVYEIFLPKYLLLFITLSHLLSFYLL